MSACTSPRRRHRRRIKPQPPSEVALSTRKTTSHEQTKSLASHRQVLLLLLLLPLTATLHLLSPVPTPSYGQYQSKIPDPVSWTVDYERRLQVARSLGRPQPTPIYVRWLHSPKTGTSFANTLVRWGCPTARETFITPRKERPADLTHPMKTTHSWDWLFLNKSGRTWLRAHCTPRLASSQRGQIRYALYMHRGLEKWEVKHAVGLFRIPLQRVYSNYVHLSQHYNESRTPRKSLASFLKRTEFWGQQSKLLLGRHYRDTKVINEDEANQAAAMIKKMLFVGLTEEFQLSCRLFHAMFGGVPHRAQFENVRPGINRYRKPAMSAAEFRYDETVFNRWRDEADDVVYKAARERFWIDVHRYKSEIEEDGMGSVEIVPLVSENLRQ